MDLQKIGAYIAAKRKALGMTQTDLAEKLGMSNKSVSKWERGVCLPDVSLYMELCRVLGITINEFIAGEDLPQERFVEKSDENIISVTRDGKQKGRRLKLVAGVLGAALAVLMVVMVVLHMPRQNYIEKLPYYSEEVVAASLVTSDFDTPHIYRFSVDRSYYYFNIYLTEYKAGEIISEKFLLGSRIEDGYRNGTIALVTDFNRSQGRVVVQMGENRISADFGFLEDVENKKLYACGQDSADEIKKIIKEQKHELLCLVYDKDETFDLLPVEEILQGNVPEKNDYTYCFTVKFE